MFNKKIKDNNGSALSLAILIIALVTIIIGTISIQVINQIKNNHNSEKSKQSKYIAEAGIENGISEFISAIDLDGDFDKIEPDFTKAYLDIVKQYMLEAKYINGNNGQPIEEQLNKIIKAIDEYEKTNDLGTIVKEIDNLLDTIGTPNNSEKQLVKIEVLIGQSYLNILQKQINQEQSISNIGYIKQNITQNSNYCVRDILDTYKVEITYENDKLNSSVDNYLSDLKNMVDNIVQNINNAISNEDYNSLNRYIKNVEKYQTIITKIISDMEIQPKDKHDYKSTVLIDEKDIKVNYGNGSGNKDFYLIVSNRMKTINLELQLLKENILYLLEMLPPDENQGGQPSNPNGSGVILKIPKSINNITQEGFGYQCMLNVDSYQKNSSLTLISDNNNEYKFKIKDTAGELLVDLSVQSNYDNKNINSKVRVIINGITQSDSYDVNYEIIDWN